MTTCFIISIILISIIILIPVCVRVSHYKRLNDNAVTQKTYEIAKLVYSDIEKYAKQNQINIKTDIRSIVVTSGFVEISYRQSIQHIEFINYDYVMDVVNGCDLKLLRLNQAIVRFIGSDKWAVEIRDENDNFIPAEDLYVSIYHNDWYSNASYSDGVKKYAVIHVKIIAREEYDRLYTEKRRYESARRF